MREAPARTLADAGCTEREIMSTTTSRMVTEYSEYPKNRTGEGRGTEQKTNKIMALPTGGADHFQKVRNFRQLAGPPWCPVYYNVIPLTTRLHEH